MDRLVLVKSQRLFTTIGNIPPVEAEPPLTTLALGEIWREVLPPGVLNVVSGPDPWGAWMTAHPVLRKVSFTRLDGDGEEGGGCRCGGSQAGDARTGR